MLRPALVVHERCQSIRCNSLLPLEIRRSTEALLGHSVLPAGAWDSLSRGRRLLQYRDVGCRGRSEIMRWETREVASRERCAELWKPGDREGFNVPSPF